MEVVVVAESGVRRREVLRGKARLIGGELNGTNGVRLDSGAAEVVSSKEAVHLRWTAEERSWMKHASCL